MPISTQPPPALDVDPDDVEGAYDAGGFADLTDDQLFALAASVVSIPRAGAANSFVLHAPLELMARRLLLPLVPAAARRAVRVRLLWVAARYERAGDPVAANGPSRSRSTSTGAAQEALVAAIAAGEVDEVDGIAAPLLAVAPLDEVMALLPPILDSLAAAGHAPIGFFLASRLALTSRAALGLLRPLLREVARAPQLRVHWADAASRPRGDEASLMTALAATPQLGLPGSDFIFPIVHQVDSSGLARELVDPAMPADVNAAARATLRMAAHSMVQDDPQFAPYGWTHCLTLPHAIFEVMPWLPDAHRAAAIAATYVVGFRAAESRGGLALQWRPEPVATDLVDALDDEPGTAAAAWYHASQTDVGTALPALIARAAGHEDAHLAKYTLACLAARERDRGEGGLYLAAAASLVAWWARRPGFSYGG